MPPMWLRLLWVLAMSDRICPRCKANIGTFTIRHRCRRKVEPQPNNTRQFQMSWIGIGDFCDLGCCDYSDKYASHSCQRPKSP